MEHIINCDTNEQMERHCDRLLQEARGQTELSGFIGCQARAMASWGVEAQRWLNREMGGPGGLGSQNEIIRAFVGTVAAATGVLAGNATDPCAMALILSRAILAETLEHIVRIAAEGGRG